MRIILLGPPGAGKGTQAGRIADRFGVPHVSTGDLFRAAVRGGTDIGIRAKEYMDAGDLVPDEIVLEMLLERLGRPDCAGGFVLDGFPRNAAQADALDANLVEIGHRLDAVVSFECVDDEIVKRLSSRASCPTCGRPYALVDGSPSACVLDGTPLVQRDDDKPEVIRQRLAVYRRQTQPLISYYEKKGLLVRVDAMGDVAEVEARIAKALEAP